MKRRGDFTVELEKDGYEPVTASVTSSIDGAGGAGMAGNVLLGGLIGAGVDAGTGAMHSHKPNPLTVTLIPVQVASDDSNAGSGNSVYDQLEQLGKLRESGVISDSEFDKEKAKLLGESTEVDTIRKTSSDPDQDMAIADE